LAVVVLYKAPDALLGTLSTAFLVDTVGLGLEAIGSVQNGLGLGATLVGAVGGAWALKRFGLWPCLLVFGLLQGATNLAYLLLVAGDADWIRLAIVIAIENLTGGAATTAFVALLLGLCHVRFSAAQYALFTALAAAPRHFGGPVTGIVAQHLGWVTFFGLTALAAIPGVAFVGLLRAEIHAIDVELGETEGGEDAGSMDSRHGQGEVGGEG